MAPKNTEVVPFAEQFPAFGANDIMTTIKENLSGDQLGQGDLEQIKMPAGGSTTWELIDADGDQSAAKTFDGIVIAMRMTRAFWRLTPEEAGGSSAPDCSSPDAEVGVGDPGGECGTCPYSQWGSARRGNGQACTLRRQMFVLTPGALMPAVLSLPPTSLTVGKHYFLRLANRNIRYRGVVTTFGLEAVTAGGNTFSKVTMAKARNLEADELAAVDAYAAVLEPIIAAHAVVDAQRFTDDDED